MQNLKAKAVSGVRWNLLRQVSNIFFKFTIGVILARLLSPEEFGIVALVTVVTDLSIIFIDSGFGSKIVQSDKFNKSALSTVFLLNIFIGTLFTIILFLVAPVFANFYQNHELIKITRTISIIYFIQSFSIVQASIFQRNLEFKKITFISIVSEFVSGIFGIILALNDFSYWAIIYRRILSIVLSTSLYWILNNWNPKIEFSFKILKEYWNYSSKIFSLQLLSKVTERFDYVLVGKFFSASELGLYYRGRDYAFMPVIFSSSIIANTFFPVFSRTQKNIDKFNTNFLLVYKLIVFTFLPVSVLFIVLAKPLIVFIIGIKWIGSVFYLQLFSMAGIVYILNSFRVNILNAKGRPDLTLKFGIIASPVRITLLILISTLVENLNPAYYIVIYLSTLFIEFFFLTHFIKIVTDIKYISQLKSILGLVLINIILGVFLHVLIKYYFYSFDYFYQILFTVLIFFTFYLLLIRFFNIELLKFFRSIILKR